MEEQVLIDGDNCFTIVNKSSILVDDKYPEIKCGAKVKYYWPERAVHKKAYIGVIIAISTNEKELRKLQAKKFKEAKKKNASRKRKASIDSESDDAEKNPEVIAKKKKEKDLKREANILSAKEYLKSLDEDRIKSSDLENKLNIAIRLMGNLVCLLQEIKQELKDSEEDASSDVELLQEENSCPKSPPLHLVEQSTVSGSIQPPSLASAINTNQQLQALVDLVENDTSGSDDEDREVETREGENFEEKLSSPQPSSLSLVAEITEPSSSLPPAKNSLTSSRSKNEEDEVYIVPKDTAGNEDVELILNSGIYIKKKALKEAKKSCTSQRPLARMLLCSIFKEDALKTRSLLGRGKNLEKKSLSIDGVEKGNPEKKILPIKGVTTILKYVQLTAKRAQWKFMEEKLIKDSLRSKLHELQKKEAIINQ